MLAISGFSGLVGHYLCDELVARGIPFKLFGRSNNKNFESVGSTFCFYDLTQPPDSSLRFFLEDVDVVIHLAALLPSSDNNLIDYFSCNSVATKSLFDLCSEVGVRSFIYFSSANLLNPHENGVVSSDSNYSFSLRQAPYLSSKIASELLLLNSSSPTNLSIVRPSSVFGHNVRFGLFRNIYNSFVHSKPVRLNQKGLWSADFIYAGDVAKCIVKIIEESISGVFTIGSGNASSILQVAKSFASVLGVEEDLIILEPCTEDLSFIGSLPAVSRDQAYSLLGRQPLSLTEGFRHAITTYGYF